jgi:uncharacterized coiled-coil protein SlyX
MQSMPVDSDFESRLRDLKFKYRERTAIAKLKKSEVAEEEVLREFKAELTRLTNEFEDRGMVVVEVRSKKIS